MLKASASSFNVQIFRPTPPVPYDSCDALLKELEGLEAFPEVISVTRSPSSQLYPWLTTLSAPLTPCTSAEMEHVTTTFLSEVPLLLRPRHIFRIDSSREPSTWRASADANGTFFAYHGSNAANWHSIIHTGIRNNSNTKRESNGAAFGYGVYLTQSLTVARDFAGVHPGWPRAQVLGKNVQMVCLYEVAADARILAGSEVETAIGAARRKAGAATRTSPDSDPIPPTYAVVPNPTLLAPRYLLVWSVPNQRSAKRPKGERKERRRLRSQPSALQPLLRGLSRVLLMLLVGLAIVFAALTAERKGMIAFHTRMASRRWLEGSVWVPI